MRAVPFLARADVHVGRLRLRMEMPKDARQ
jgi:hypothetical protein